MYEKLGMRVVKSGEEVELGVVTGPDAEWSPRLVPFLSHKGGEWVSQIRKSIDLDLSPLVTKFFILFKTPDDILSNICTWRWGGVANLGHVFTTPNHRRKGAASILMKASMDDFRNNAGRAMYLGTGYDTPPFHIYEEAGFRGVYPRTGFMEYYSGKREDFLAEEFAGEKAGVVDMTWRHWPRLVPLFGQELGGVLRFPGEGVNGRANFEGPFIPIMHSLEETHKKCLVLEGLKTGASGGAAIIGPDRRFAGSANLLDVFFHPNFAKSAAGLVEAAIEGVQGTVVSYVDTSYDERIKVLKKAGFKKAGTIPEGVTAPGGMPEEGRKFDIVIMARK